MQQVQNVWKTYVDIPVSHDLSERFNAEEFSRFSQGVTAQLVQILYR